MGGRLTDGRVVSLRGARPALVGVRVALLVVACVLLAGVFGVAPALALPEGRVYEQVSPEYKGGYGAANPITAVAPNGESVVFLTQGVFAGEPFSGLNNYLSRRGETGWSTVPLAPPATVAPATKEPVDFSPTLETTLAQVYLGPNQGAAEGKKTENEFLLHSTSLPDVAANFNVAGEVLRTLNGKAIGPGYAGASPNFSHIVFHTSSNEPLLSEAEAASGQGQQLYDLASDGGGGPTLRLVGVNDSGELIDPACPVQLGSGSSAFNAIASDGSEIFFTMQANRSDPACGAGPGNPAIVFVRVDGASTVQVSGVALPAGCAVSAPCRTAPVRPGEFQGADESGSCVLFTTSQPLVTGDTDLGNDLYLARIGRAGEAGTGCAPSSSGGQGPVEETSLTQVSHDPSAGEAAEVQGVVAISPDGSRVYFVAHGVLSEGPNAEGGVAVKGADNLYVYDTASGGAPVFVTDLCSGPDMSGEAPDVSCPSNLLDTGNARNDTKLWQDGGAHEAQLAGDGRFLLFSTFGRLRPDDTDTAKDVYLYDVVSGSLQRVSAGEAGYDANGNASVCGGGESACDAKIGEPGLEGFVSSVARLDVRNINEEGTRVVFTTAERLSPHAINGLENVYEWHREPGWSEGRVSLISTGSATQPVSEVVMSSSGRDVFFVTSQGLVPQDTDGANDVYDARLGGGFPSAPAPSRPCSGDACQGPLTNPAPLLVPGSVSQESGENFAAPAPVPVVKAKSKSIACRKGFVRRKAKCVKRAKAKGSTAKGRK